MNFTDDCVLLFLTKYILVRHCNVSLHLGQTAQISSHLSCMVAFTDFTTQPVSLAFPACRSAVVYLSVSEVKVETQILTDSLFSTM